MCSHREGCLTLPSRPNKQYTGLLDLSNEIVMGYRQKAFGSVFRRVRVQEAVKNSLRYIAGAILETLRNRLLCDGRGRVQNWFMSKYRHIRKGSLSRRATSPVVKRDENSFGDGCTLMSFRNYMKIKRAIRAQSRRRLKLLVRQALCCETLKLIRFVYIYIYIRSCVYRLRGIRFFS